MATSWHGYYDAVRTSEPPRPTLLSALRAHEGPPGTALDLGCGAGRDTRALLESGWRVYAIDAEPEALVRLDRGIAAQLRQRLVPMIGRFEEIRLPLADLANASFSLPFCPPARFPALWQSIMAALDPRGIFSGQLFGDRDSWAHAPHMTFHSRAAVAALFDGWTTIDFEESGYDGGPAVGPAKHWHFFNVVARHPR